MEEQSEQAKRSVCSIYVISKRFYYSKTFSSEGRRQLSGRRKAEVERAVKGIGGRTNVEWV